METQTILTPELRKIAFPVYVCTDFNNYPNTHYKIIDENTMVMITEDSMVIYKDQEAVRIALEALHRKVYKETDSDNFKVAYAKTLTKINSLINQ